MSEKKESPAMTMARRYYPKYWGEDRIIALRDVGKLTEAEAAEITGGKEQDHDNGQQGH